MLRELRQLDKAAAKAVFAGSIRIRRLKAQDWAESWKHHFPDLLVGSTLLVKPSWSKRRPSATQTEVVLDPGLAFGTGLHPTTHYCLRQVVRFRPRREPRTLLDLGTGSGILAIAAAKLGYEPVDAVDNDRVSVRVAKANAKRNKVRINLVPRDLLDGSWRSFRTARTGRSTQHGYDVVCANLVYDVLLLTLKQVVNCVKERGVLVLAGILERQFAEVAAAYGRAGMTLIGKRTEKEWTSCLLRKGDRLAT
jgi:ribosomal protein L11 methyltransferase